MMKRFVYLLLVFLLAACGYSFSGHNGALPGGVERLYIPLFVNKTNTPQLENRLTGYVSEVFARNDQCTLVENPYKADGVLTGIITDYRTRAMAYDATDDIGQYRATMTITVMLQAQNVDQPLWRGTLDWSSEYVAADDKMVQDGLEEQAINELSQRLAEELHNRILNNF
ncbi:MAG: hypothetical protein C0622_05755 [Desulfuromonas sp.]|nr:MAG: hypothetical protein C0622_05755 [Desulfuromonas sp.]